MTRDPVLLALRDEFVDALAWELTNINASDALYGEGRSRTFYAARALFAAKEERNAVVDSTPVSEGCAAAGTSRHPDGGMAEIAYPVASIPVAEHYCDKCGKSFPTRAHVAEPIEIEAKKYRCLCGSTDTFIQCNSCGERWFMPGQMQASINAHKAVAEPAKRGVEEILGEMRNRAISIATMPATPDRHAAWLNLAPLFDEALRLYRDERVHWLQECGKEMDRRDEARAELSALKARIEKARVTLRAPMYPTEQMEKAIRILEGRDA